MARLLALPHDNVGTAREGIGALSFLLCMVALLMCASHGKKWRLQRHRLVPWRHYCSEPVIQVLDMDSRFLTTTRVQPGGFGEGTMGGAEGAACVWQKKILMGEKCQLPDFSGLISYDSDGNIITATPSCTVHTVK